MAPCSVALYAVSMPPSLPDLRARLGGIPQIRLAALLGISPVTVNRTEQGHTSGLTGINALLVDLLAAALDTVPAAELLPRLERCGGRHAELVRVLIKATEPTASRLRKTR